MNYKVLLTTSGIGSRLGKITDFTNKGLVKVGKKPAISYIIESYPINVEFVITIGHYGSHIKQFLKLAYPDRLFTFVNVDNYNGLGSSLGYSQLCARKYLQCPFIYNACDTIILNEIIPEPSIDWVGGFKQNGSSQYDSYCADNNIVKEFYSKGYIESDWAYIGLIGVYDYKDYWDTLEKLYNNDPNGLLSDFYCVKEQLKYKKIYHNEFKNWYDIGNVESLNKARQLIPDSFNILNKLEESIFIFDDFVIKFFVDTNIVQDRVRRAELLKDIVPTILDYSENFYKYKYSIGNLYSDVVNTENFKLLLDFAKNKLWIKNEIYLHDDFIKNNYDFYYNKTITRLNKFYKDTNNKDSNENINGINVFTINHLMSLLDDNFYESIQTGFHGDFILDNIIYDNINFILLDWRQNFGKFLDVGDLYYDLAKLNHNLTVNHEIINNNQFLIKKIDENIIVDIHRRQSLVDCQEILYDWIIKNGYDLNKVKILTSIIWLNMSPLHHYPFNEFLYYYGKLTLHKHIIQKNNER